MPLTKIQPELIPDEVVQGGHKNLIINPYMDIAQRGTSFVGVADGDYTLDRFSYIKSGVMVHNINQVADAPTTVQAGTKLVNSLSVDVTTPDTVISADDYCSLVYQVEGYDFRKISGQTFTLSFWVKATTTGTYSIGLQNSGATRLYVSEYTVNTTNTWERKSITVTHDETGTWDYSNGSGLKINFVLAAGSNKVTSSLDVWQNSSVIASSNQVNGVNTGSTNFRLTGVQIELGNTATALEHRKYTDELAMCQRYYERQTNYRLGIIGDTAITTRYPIQFKTIKRTTPTIALTQGSLIGATTGVSTSALEDYAFLISFSSSSGVGVRGIGSLSDAEWSADAEL